MLHQQTACHASQAMHACNPSFPLWLVSLHTPRVAHQSDRGIDTYESKEDIVYLVYRTFGWFIMPQARTRVFVLPQGEPAPSGSDDAVCCRVANTTTIT
ncbi:hypothetical protein BaRGS_00014365 [Batillaria attramentaria]|uniref:Uncharacterized protein n=1 Tax=Batillaria attramentaria TaxID=370345 RepID=A0ABD0L5D7_9CAEN